MNKEMVHWAFEEGGKTAAELLNAGIEASHAPKEGLLLVERHSIGILSPNWLASLIVALKSGEYEAWLYGPEGIEQKRIQQMARDTKRYIQSLEDKIEWIEDQLRSPIYKPRRE